MRRLVKSMLESIKSNSFIRRVILGSIVILLMLIASWGVFQNYKLEKIYADKAEISPPSSFTAEIATSICAP